MNNLKRMKRFLLSPFMWAFEALRMRTLVRCFQVDSPIIEGAGSFGVVIMPWCDTAVPWFSLVWGLFFSSKGNKVIFIIDDMLFGKKSFSFKLQIFCISTVVKLVRERYEVITLSKYFSFRPLTDSELSSIHRLAKLNAIWELKGEMESNGRQLLVELFISQLTSTYLAIWNFLNSIHLDVLFIPGGIWGSSGIWSENARSVGVRVASFDSVSKSILLLSVNGLACQLQDIPSAFTLLKNFTTSDEKRSFVIRSALEEISRRHSGLDRFSFQILGNRVNDGLFTGAVMIALNSSWDSAALGLHTVFESSEQWIVETVKYLLEHVSSPVVVRQHPVERLEIARSSDNYHELLRRHFGNNSRLHFIAADDPVNTYDLFKQVVAVVAYSSTIGVEAAAHGKVVITESSNYYSDMGFVWKAANVKQYREFLLDAAEGRLTVTREMRDDALFCYYITQCCNWVTTPFTIAGYSEWSRQDLRTLLNDKSVELMINAIVHNTPISYLSHLESIELNSSQ